MPCKTLQRRARLLGDASVFSEIMENKPEAHIKEMEFNVVRFYNRHVVAKVAYQYAEANKTPTHLVMKRTQLNRKQQQKSRECVKRKLMIFYRTLDYSSIICFILNGF